jgi:hypothetical protein
MALSIESLEESLVKTLTDWIKENERLYGEFNQFPSITDEVYEKKEREKEEKKARRKEGIHANLTKEQSAKYRSWIRRFGEDHAIETMVERSRENLFPADVHEAARNGWNMYERMRKVAEYFAPEEFVTDDADPSDNMDVSVDVVSSDDDGDSSSDEENVVGPGETDELVSDETKRRDSDDDDEKGGDSVAGPAVREKRKSNRGHTGAKKGKSDNSKKILDQEVRSTRSKSRSRKFGTAKGGSKNS